MRQLHLPLIIKLSLLVKFQFLIILLGLHNSCICGEMIHCGDEHKSCKSHIEFPTITHSSPVSQDQSGVGNVPFWCAAQADWLCRGRDWTFLSFLHIITRCSYCTPGSNFTFTKKNHLLLRVQIMLEDQLIFWTYISYMHKVKHPQSQSTCILKAPKQKKELWSMF